MKQGQGKPKQKKSKNGASGQSGAKGGGGCGKQSAERPRWEIPAAGAAIQILTGIPAAFGTFREPLLRDFSLDEDGVGLMFVLLVAAYGVGCLLGGFLQDLRGPRVAGISGSLLLGGGFVASAFLPGQRPVLFWLVFSLPVGLGSAFLYPAVMSTAQKWFPGQKGLITGIIGGAVGLSGGFLTLFVRLVAGRWGMGVCFFWLGALMLLVCLGGSLLLQNPPPKPQLPAEQGRQFKVPPFDLPPKKMLALPQFWLGFGMVLLAAPTMLLFSPIIVKLGQERGLSEAVAHLSIVVGSVGSAAGRLACPAASDRFGRRAVCLWVFGLLAAISVALGFAAGVWIIFVYTALAFCYSGLAAVIPALSTDLFGLPHAGVNYGFLALGMSAGSLGSWFLARALSGMTSGILVRHSIAVAAALAGGACALFLRPTRGTKL